MRRTVPERVNEYIRKHPEAHNMLIADMDEIHELGNTFDNILTAFAYGHMKASKAKHDKEKIKNKIIHLLLNLHNAEDLQKIYLFVKSFANDEKHGGEESHYRRSVIEMAIKLPDNLLKRVYKLAEYLYIYKTEDGTA